VKRLASCLSIVLLLLLSSGSQGAEVFEKVGTIGIQTLKIGVGARAAGMGSGFVAVGDDAACVYWNPAGIARLGGSAVSLNHAAWPAEIWFDQAAYTFSVEWIRGVFGVSARALTMDAMPRTTPFHPGGDGTYFDAGEMIFGLTYARSLTDKFALGATANWYHSGLDRWAAEGFSFDLGTLYDTGFRSIKVGMAIQNIGAPTKYIDETVKLPTTFRVGVSMKLWEAGSQSLLAVGEFSHPPDNAEKANGGFEYSFQDFFYVRGGYNLNSDEAGVAGGIGVNFPASSTSIARLDYAFTDMDFLGGVHRVSISLNF